VKRLLDLARTACNGRVEPILDLCHKFNSATKDGRDMKRYSLPLDQAIRSLIDVKEESDIFTPGSTTALVDSIRGLDDFDLIAFIVIQDAP
jgi:hypothetical protein